MHCQVLRARQCVALSRLTASFALLARPSIAVETQHVTAAYSDIATGPSRMPSPIRRERQSQSAALTEGGSGVVHGDGTVSMLDESYSQSGLSGLSSDGAAWPPPPGAGGPPPPPGTAGSAYHTDGLPPPPGTAGSAYHTGYPPPPLPQRAYHSGHPGGRAPKQYGPTTQFPGTPLYQAEQVAKTYEHLMYDAEVHSGLPNDVYTSSTPVPFEEEEEEYDMVWVAISFGMLVFAAALFYSDYVKLQQRKFQKAHPHEEDGHRERTMSSSSIEKGGVNKAAPKSTAAPPPKAAAKPKAAPKAAAAGRAAPKAAAAGNRK